MGGSQCCLNTYLLDKHFWVNEWVRPSWAAQDECCLPKRPKLRLFFMSWSKTTGNANVSNERLTDGKHLAVGSHVHHLPTTAYTGRPNPDACWRGTVSRDPAPQWSLSPILSLEWVLVSKTEKGNRCGFYIHPPPSSRKSICWPVFVSIHFCLDLSPSWDWRADRKRQSIPHGALGLLLYGPYWLESAIGLGAEKN